MIIELKKCPKWRKQVLALNEHNEQVEKMATWVEWWIRRAGMNRPKPTAACDGVMADDKPRWMVLTGNTGTGKTHCLKRANIFFLAHAIDIYPHHWRNPPSVYFMRWVKSAQSRHEEWKDIIRDASEANIVFIDDAGADVDQFRQGEKNARLQELLDTVERKWCLITTNIMPEDWKDRLDLRNASRLKASTIVRTDKIEDYRSRTGAVSTP